MKLAEALLLRADIQKKLESLRERISKNTVVQEGEKPSEDPNKLLEQVTAISSQLSKLIFAINEANFTGMTSRNRLLTEALAERDALVLRHSIIRGAAASAVQPPERYGMKEIRWVKTVDVAGLQKAADDLAKTLRDLNAEIQAANWQIDIKDI
jgi:hypothetical protein